MTLKLSPITSEINVDEYNFNNGSINNKLRNAYYLHIMKLARVYKIEADDKIIGFCVLSLMSIYDDESTGTYHAIYLDTLCIDVNFQHRKIGTFVLNYIIEFAEKISDVLSIRYLILDAVNEYKMWYNKNGFKYMNPASINSTEPTVRMKIDFRDDNLVNEYFSI